MTEQELRVLVRDAIARSQAGRVVPRAPGLAGLPSRHMSHAMFAVPDGADADGPCIIEPAVGCTHCGYCRSMGH